MKKLNIEWYLLRNALIVLSLSLVIGTTLVFNSYQLFTNTQQEEKDKTAEFNKLKKDYEDTVKSLGIVNGEALKQFKKLHQTGYFIDETNANDFLVFNRQENFYDDMNKLLSELKRNNKLFDGEIDVEDIQEITHFEHIGFDIKDGFFVSKMPIKVTFGILHEGDLLEFIDEIEHYYLSTMYYGLLNFQYCNVKRNLNEFKLTEATKPYFEVECT